MPAPDDGKGEQQLDLDLAAGSGDGQHLVSPAELAETDASSWLPTRAAGLERLRSFVRRAGREYARTRNYDDGRSRENVSGLSPYVRRRLVSEVEVARAVLDEHSPSVAEKFLQEVFWRTYWRGWLYLRPQVYADFLADLGTLRQQLETDRRLGAAYQKALGATTGIACFDEWAVELRETGYLHNHTRMWVASIWIFTLRLPWQLGADWFARHLLDADPASNTLSWRWVAGLHTRGKHYLARAANIRKFTRGRFDPSGQLDEAAVPISDSRTYLARQFQELTPANTLMPASERVGWLLTDDDLLGADLQFLSEACVVAILAPERQQATVANRFVQGAVVDARKRIEATGIEASLLSPHDVVELARALRLDAVAALDPGCCANRQRLLELENHLESNGVRLDLRMHNWERQLFPFATAGYFKFKKQLPRLVEQLRPLPSRSAAS